MPILAAIVGTAGGGRITPPKPNITRSSAGIFVINNYDTQYIYTRTDGVSVTSSTISMPNATSSTTVIVSSQKGFTSSTYLERAPYTYSCRQVSYSCACNCRAVCNGYCTGGEPCPPGVGQGFQECGCPTFFCGTISVVCDTCTCCCNTVCDVLNDRSAEGFTNGGNEWFKVI